jgi:hypothetical protein
MPQMLELEGEVIGDLSTLIGDAFDRDDLRFLLRVKLNFNLDQELDVSKSDKNLIFALILKLEKRGIIVDFLRRVIEARPDLRDAVGRNCLQALQAAPDARVAANTGAASLDAVKAKLDDPAVRSLIAPHRDELARLMEGIEVLANYKRLHDYLQTIQLTHQLQMVSDMQRLRNDEIAGTTLDAHVFELNDICGKALAAAKSLPDTAAVQAAELRWIDKLKSVIDQIQRAVDSLDDREGARALRALRLLIPPGILSHQQPVVRHDGSVAAGAADFDRRRCDQGDRRTGIGNGRAARRAAIVAEPAATIEGTGGRAQSMAGYREGIHPDRRIHRPGHAGLRPGFPGCVAGHEKKCRRARPHGTCGAVGAKVADLCGQHRYQSCWQHGKGANRVYGVPPHRAIPFF